MAPRLINEPQFASTICTIAPIKTTTNRKKSRHNMKRILLFLLTFIHVTICYNQSNLDPSKHKVLDTTASFKIDSYWVTPKQSFEFNSLGKTSTDTLHLVTCAEYVYFPFGKITDTYQLKTSLLKDFKIIRSQLDTFTNTMSPDDPSDDLLLWTESVELELGTNTLSLFLDNDPNTSIQSYLSGGQILDNKVVFQENVKVGMSIEDFYEKFFVNFPNELHHTYKVIKLESCVSDLTHIYTFDKGQLSSVKFMSNSDVHE